MQNVSLREAAPQLDYSASRLIALRIPLLTVREAVATVACGSIIVIQGFFNLWFTARLCSYKVKTRVVWWLD